MSKKSSVPVQKGKIDPAVKTMKTMTYHENVKEKGMQLRETKDGQTLKLHIPKK